MIAILVTIAIGILSGIVLATPPGVINLTILHYLSKGNRRNALWVGAGSAFLDIFYGALAMYSASAVYVALSDFILSNPRLMQTLEVLLILSIVSFGMYKLFLQPKGPRVSEFAEPSSRIRKLHPFFLGCALALTHIVVPTFLPGYAYLATILIN